MIAGRPVQGERVDLGLVNQNTSRRSSDRATVSPLFFERSRSFSADNRSAIW